MLSIIFYNVRTFIFINSSRIIKDNNFNIIFYCLLTFKFYVTTIINMAPLAQLYVQLL